ncbi:MAG TPA: outer membrane beta-barrel protein [Puia sp.]|nr:outer membrane beta-barrel protein [Puia sp.]
MEHLENDMDDLYQKAGELYPLKTTGSDWDAVAGKLQNESPGEVHDLSGLTALPTRRRTWLLLLLLIPLGLGIFHYSGNQTLAHQNAVPAKPLSGSADQNKLNSANPDKHPMPVGPSDNNKTAASDNIQSPSAKKNSPENGSINGPVSNKSKRLAYAAGGKQFTADHILNSKKQISSANSQKQISSADERTKSDLNSNNSNQGSKGTETVVADKSIDNASAPRNESVQKAEVAAVPVVISTQKETTAAKNNTDKTEPSKKSSQDSTSEAKKKTSTNSKQSKGFYVGLFAGPDVSTVKFQSVNNLGFSLGALIGYRFNNRLSIESGLIWDKKYYYSNGEYYKKDGASLPPTATLDGSCSMFEIPVDIRFDFATKKNHGFFAKTGLSSYLMTSEKYTFNYAGMPSYPWKNDSLQNNIFSILQISGGYERVISDKTKIRVEPYVKIPLQGIGRGDMPIASFGIYLGITHSFR